MMVQGYDHLEIRAKQLYEQARKIVAGRPKWEDLNPNDPYDMGMRETAMNEARGDWTPTGRIQPPNSPG